MRHILTVQTFLILAIVLNSCKKNNTANECFSGVPTIRQITDKPAVIKVTATIYAVYIVEQGAIDTRLIPCNLPKEFIQNDLQVTISGEVKNTPQGSGPCCAENFVITKITR